jgi:hypothetical protein
MPRLRFPAQNQRGSLSKLYDIVSSSISIKMSKKSGRQSLTRYSILSYTLARWRLGASLARAWTSRSVGMRDGNT